MKHVAISPFICLLLAVGLLGLPAGQTRAASAGGADLTPETGQRNLPVVLLQTTNTIEGDVRVPCTVQILCPAGTGCGVTNRLAGVVGLHGASSRGYPKKSYAFTLEQPASLLDLRTNAHWVLNAAYIDRSLMRHKLSYDLFRSWSVKGAERFAIASRFVEVQLNGDYRGAYLLMERVDRSLLGLRPFGSNDVSHACIYKAIDHAANFGQPGRAGYEQREPDPLTHPYWRPLDEFNRFVSTAPDAKFFDPQTGIESRLDLDNAIDFHLLVLLTSNGDGITKNFILARDGQESGVPSQRFFFVPWDYDGTFGRNWDASPVPPSVWLSNNLFDRLLGQAAYRARFAARWRQLRERGLSAKSIQGMIEANAQTLGEAPRRNAACWPTTNGPAPDELTFVEEIDQMKRWVEERIQWLDQAINHLSDQH